MKPTEALTYLDQCAAAFLSTLPPVAIGPTRQAILQAIDVLKPLALAAEIPASPPGNGG